jgi:arabinose-5-phosphate isomerase
MVFLIHDKKSDFEISEKRLGVTAVIEHDKVIGIITDGDIRRMLNEILCRINCKDIMTKNQN